MKKSAFFIYLLIFSVLGNLTLFAQIPGEQRIISAPKTETVAEIMSRRSLVVKNHTRPEKKLPSRRGLPQDPSALNMSSTHVSVTSRDPQALGAQTLGTSFNGITGPTENGAFPPDNMGAVGPTQYIVFVNGRLRSFTKAGVADGVLDIDPDVFFASVMTPVSGGAFNFTSDPRIRFDRHSGKWILIIIDVPSFSSVGDRENRCLIAYSNTSTITGATVWTFRFFQAGTNRFLDYPTLGLDKNALFIGGNMFSASTGAFLNCDAFVINRATLLSGGGVTATAFTNLIGADGPFTPQGVDNLDGPTPTEGYFIGVSNAAFGRLIMRRISTPAGVPTISANISITTATTSPPINMDHLGDANGTAGNLDGIDDRLYAAVARNGQLWTAHNIAVTSTGVASNVDAQRRNGTRWYNLTNLTTATPTIVQSGTIWDPAATVATAKQYSFATIMVSGQGHAAFSMSTAGTPYRANAETAGRLSGDALGTTQAPIATTASSTAYNPPGDPGGPRRWGDYSYVSLDPQDDMTMWMINQFCNATNTYGAQVTKLIAPPPATSSSCSPSSIANGLASVNVIVTGTSVSGSGYYDPGVDLPPPSLPFNHISATVSGGITVNSVTYTDPTHITLNLNTTGATAGPHTITVTNPDGQFLTSGNILTTTSANNSPVVTTSGGITAFTEGNNVTSTPAVIDGSLTVTDDGTTLASGTVSITGGLQTSQDLLSFTNDGSTMGNIAGSYNAGTGVLGLTSAGAIATVAQWQSALRSVTYTNSSNTPNTTNRTVSFQVNDGTNNSNIATKTVSVTATNDDPIITSNGGGPTAAISVPENTTVVTTVTATDADGTTPTYTLNGGADASKFMLNPTTGALAFITAPDFETPIDANTDNQYIVIVRATDGTANDDQTITVTVTDASEGLIVTNANPSAVIDFSNTTPSTAGTNPQTAFAGTGFSPDPATAGRLNSNAWAVTGWSDGALAFGGTQVTTNTDYTRGLIGAAVTTGGMYAYTGAPGSAANPTLMIQPGGSDFAPGSITLKVQNKGTTAITQLSVSYNLYIRNDQGRANSFNFSHSGDNTTYTSVGALNYTSPEVLDAAGWVLVGSAPSRATTITGLNIPVNGVYYLRWSSADVSGSGSRDEFGLDDININATYFVPVANFYVNDNSLSGDLYTTAVGSNANPGTQAAPFLTIQHAINTVPEGSTIYVDAGTYVEQVNINKTLTIIGAGRSGGSTTQLKAPVTLTSITNANSTYHPLVYANGVGKSINIQKMLIDGDGGRNHARFIGVFYYEAGGTFENNRVTSIQRAPFDGLQDGDAIVVNHQYDASLSHTATINNNLIDNYQKTGIIVNELNARGIVTNNTITGKSITGVLAQNGIQFGFGSYGTITGNTVSGNLWNSTAPHTYMAAGILLVGVGVDNTNTPTGNATTIGGAVALANNVAGNETGLYTDGDFDFGYSSNANVTYGGDAYANNKVHVYINSPASVPTASNTYDKRVDNPAQTNTVFGSIQYPIDFASAGNTLNASAGSFVEQVVVNKSLTILGANATVNPCTGSRVAESIIMPSASQPFYDGTTEVRMMQIEASNVVVKGFTFDGNNPALTTNVIDAADGIDVYSDVQGINIQNNIFKNINEGGINAFPSGSTVQAGNIINDNKFDNIPGNSDPAYPGSGYGIGVLVYNNFYTTINNNCMTNVRIGVQTGNYNLANTGSTVPTINNNTVESKSVGIWHNLHYQSASAFTIDNNTVTTVSGALNNTGLFISSLQTAVAVNVNNNNVTGARWGVELWNNPTTSMVTVSGGTLTNCTTGVFANNYDSYSSNAESSAYLVKQITIQNSDTAVHVKDNAANSNVATVALTLNNAFITGGIRGVAISGADAYATVNNNSITGNTGFAVDASAYTGTTAINAECNWYGTTSQSAIAAKMAGNVDYLHYLTDGTDAQPGTQGFQPAAGVCNGPLPVTEIYVNDNSNTGDTYTTAPGNDATGNGTPSAPYRTITKAIMVASKGSKIYVDAGTFIEGVVITKRVSLFGTNANINACSGSRVAESIIMPSGSQPFYDGSTEVRMMQIEADSVVVKGFTFDGNNPALVTHVIDAADGIDIYANVDSITIQNNIFKNINEGGINAFPTGGVAQTQNIINDNKFDNIPGDFDPAYPFSGYGIGVLVYNDFYTTINNNCMTNVRLGVQTGNYYVANTGSTAPSINNNTIESKRVGIWHNLHYVGASTFTINNNTVTTFAGSTNNQGIAVTSIQSAVSVNVNDNNISGARYGYYLWNNPTTSTVTISGGNVTGADTAVYATNYDDLYGNSASSSYLVKQLNIQNPVSVGVMVIDTSANSNGASVSLTLNNTFVSSGAKGVVVRGADVTAIINNNSITGSTDKFIDAGGYTGVTPVNAECNWYGTTDDAAIAAKMAGNVDYLPFLTNGSDDQPATAGFQPVTGSCNGMALITYYPRTTATDLSQASNWTDAPSGTGGNSPANFSSPNQLFNLNTNVANPVVNGSWGISGGSNLVLNNAAPLLFTTTANFSLGSGSTADFNGKPVTLKSSATGTAFMGIIEGSLTNASNVTVERYLSSNNNRAYRLLAPSVNTATNIRANWQEGVNNPNENVNFNPAPGYGTHITGNGTNGFDATQTGQGSLFTYNPVTPAWEYINNTDVNMLDAKKGYLMYIRGDRSIDLNSTANPLPSANTTLRATGTLLTGTQNFVGTTGNNGFNLITNPYAAPVNWQSIFSGNPAGNFTQFYTLWDPNIGSQGGYVTVGTLGIPSNPSSNANLNIQSGQAFFVQASGVPAPTVNIMETHKSTVNNVDVFRAGTHNEMFTSSLFYTNGQGNRVNADGVTSLFNNNYSQAVDGNDATQIANWDEDIAISRNNNALSIESRPLIDIRDTIPFIMARLQQRSYEWQFNANGFTHPNLFASLVDNFTGITKPVSLNGVTVIQFTVTGNPASSAANRFMVVFGPNVALPVNMSNVKAYQKGKDIQVEWTAQTELNLDKYEVEESVDGRQFIKATTVIARGITTGTTYDWLDVNVNNGSNYYRIKAISKTGEVQYSKVVRVNIGKAVNEITVYPNPTNDNIVTLSINLPKGQYTVTLTNKLGQQVYAKQINHLGGASTQTLRFSPKLAQGIYQLTVSDGETNYVQQLMKE